MQGTAQDDDRVMTLVELALAHPSGERERYLRTACGADPELFGTVWSYVQQEERMSGFLLEPLIPSFTVEHPFEPDDLLEGRFRIVREIAHGGMGVVYEAIDEKLERRIALKCAKAGFGNRLPPEARNATAISHPNVCKTFEIHTTLTSQGSIDFLTMEFLDGETLSERLTRGPLPEPEARELARQLCAGLAEAHRNHVTHGDLKSNNVILARAADGAMRAVITDFGMARMRDAAGQAGGTPDYMAPELWRGDPATAASDMYALGVILHELISGARSDSGQVIPGLPKRWSRVIARCLDAEPARRFPTAGEVAQALSPISRRWAVAAAAAAVLVVASGVIGYQRAAAPRESMKLTVLPFEAAGEAGALAEVVSLDVAKRVADLRGGDRVKLSVTPGAQSLRSTVRTAEMARVVFGATHVVRGTVRFEGGGVVLHAFVTDTSNGANAGEREFQYGQGELRYAGGALAGMVRAALRLPGATPVPVNAAAKVDYTAGVAFTRRNSTVERALPLLERAVLADPDSPLTWAALAEARWFKYLLAQDGTWLERTKEALRQARNRDSDVAAVHRVAGLLLANESFYEQAIAEYGRAIDIDPTNSDAYRRIGQAYEQTNQLGPALAAYQRAVDAEPTYFRVYQDLGTYYLHRGEMAQAIQRFQKCVDIAPDEPDTHYVLGTAYMNADQFAAAEPELRAAIALGETPRAINNLALTLMYLGRDRDAIPVLVHGLDRFPNRYLWWMNLADGYRRTGATADSARAYRRSLELAEKEMARDPRAGEVRARVGYLCARLGERSRAESEIAQALQLAPESIDAQHAAVWVYEALGRRDDTLALLKKAPDRVVEVASRGQDMADLRQDSRYQDLKESRQKRKELTK